MQASESPGSSSKGPFQGQLEGKLWERSKRKLAEKSLTELEKERKTEESDGATSDTMSDVMSVCSAPDDIDADSQSKHFWRKRPAEDDKSGAVKRGRGRPPSTGKYVGLQKAKTELAAAQRAAEKEERLAAEMKRVDEATQKLSQTRASAKVSRVSATSESEDDVAKLTAVELKSRLSDALAAIKQVSSISKGLKSSCVTALKVAMSSISEASEELLQRTASDEVARLNAKNKRLEVQIAELRREHEELWADFRKACSDSCKLGGSAPSGNGESEIITLVKQELASLNSRFSVLEGRMLRPPLAASSSMSYASKAATSSSGQRRAKRAEVPAPDNNAPEVSQTLESEIPKIPKLTSAVESTATKNGNKKRRKGKKAIAGVTALPSALPMQDLSCQQSTHNPTVGQWETVGKDKKKKNASKKKRRKLRIPNTAAVIITLQPDASEKGTTYGELLKKAKSVINPTEFGIEAGIRCKPTRTGARMLEIPGATSGPKADALAEKLRALFPVEDVRVSRPIKCADLRISGLDDSVTQAEVITAIASYGECPTEHIKTGNIHKDYSGMGAITVACPVAVANKLSSGKRLLVGWVSAQVKLLEPRATICYRCHAGGHISAQCTSEVDRSTHCLCCGQPGHMASTCTSTPHCVLCATVGKPAEHRVCSKACTAPKILSRKTGGPIGKSPEIGAARMETQ